MSQQAQTQFLTDLARLSHALDNMGRGTAEHTVVMVTCFEDGRAVPADEALWADSSPDLGKSHRGEGKPFCSYDCFRRAEARGAVEYL